MAGGVRWLAGPEKLRRGAGKRSFGDQVEFRPMQDMLVLVQVGGGVGVDDDDAS